jgi:polar amino acid transport system ATP-binding protein
MDEGTIYEEGTPQQIFENPQKEKTRAFIHRIRSVNRHIASIDFDLYRLNGEIEQFCEKHFLPRSAMLDLQLLVEELLSLHKVNLDPFVVDLSIAYSEKSGRLELVFETADTGRDSLVVPEGGDDLQLTLIRGTAASLEQRVEKGKRRLEIGVRTS